MEPGPEMGAEASRSRDLDAQKLLDAARNHDIPQIQALARKMPTVSVQDPETGSTPLHVAIAACRNGDGASGDASQASGNMKNGEEAAGELIDTNESSAAAVLRLLLQQGAIWNDLSNEDETPGCLAYRLGLKELYGIMVDAGVRAEMLLNRLDEYEQLDSEGNERDCGEIEKEAREGEEDELAVDDGPELLPVAQQAKVLPNKAGEEVAQAKFLMSNLSFQDGRIVDADQNGVMMCWESEIMQQSARLIAPADGLRVLNIGHGMGMVDSSLQQRSPSKHHIIEAHPQILDQMRQSGWYSKQGVVVHEGKWQDILPKLVEEGQIFDAIYFDTFGEDYKALRKFFDDYVIAVLDEGGRWSFFNGLGADRQICYDVYKSVVEMDLFESGYEVEWYQVEVPDLEARKTWEGLQRAYWRIEGGYWLPVVSFVG